LNQNSISTHIIALVALIKSENPLHSNFIDEAMANLRPDELQRLGLFLAYCNQNGLDSAYMCESYLTLVEDTISEQIYFKKHQHYRYSSFKEVAQKVYFDPDYMDRYMHGLAISTFLWPNHVRITRYFKQTIPKRAVGSYLEVGPGHGQFLMMAMQECSYDSYLGVDISATSIKQTRNVIDYFLPDISTMATLETRDFLAKDDLEACSFDAIVAGEVVEHVEQPEPFFRRIAELAKPDAHIFLTTCINTPAIDHIYLWRTPQELESMIRDCGLTIRDRLTLPYQGKSLDEAIAEDLSVNFAFLLSKA
jgi:2-polyprenyl-3-methyl-5-hydroxy-6-metoxy-1,4-benzoquinol methylase